MRFLALAAAGLLLALASSCAKGQRAIQNQLDKGTGVVQLPPGVTELKMDLRIPVGAKDLEIVGSEGSILRPSAEFDGRALITMQNCSGVKLRNFSIDGGRSVNPKGGEIPLPSATYTTQFPGNGILVDEVTDVTITNVDIREVTGFGIIAARTKKITIDKVTIQDSGGRNARNVNNTSGGILFEESMEDFTVRNSTLRRVTGNGIWTHSVGFSTRNQRGLISNNTLELIGRHAIEINHGNRVRIENNTIKFAGFPPDAVDAEAKSPPAAIATSARVDESVITGNKATEINGRCMDLDGLHDSEVSKNTCTNQGELKEYPQGSIAITLGNSFVDMQSQLVTFRDNVVDRFRYGALFLIGQDHKVLNNTFQNLNENHCNEGLETIPCDVRPGEPNRHKAGIYIGMHAERLANTKGIMIEGNRIQGYGMKSSCVLPGPTVQLSDHKVSGNTCVDSN